VIISIIEQVDTISLYTKIKAAFTSNGGELDISRCEITESFCLVQLVLAHKEGVLENDLKIWLEESVELKKRMLKNENVEVSFSINAFRCIFRERADFSYATFQSEVLFNMLPYNNAERFIGLVDKAE
jgi:hypothetical protein